MEVTYKINNVVIESFVTHPDGRKGPVNSNTSWEDTKTFTHFELNNTLQMLHQGLLFSLVKQRYKINSVKMTLECSATHSPSDKLAIERTF